MPRSPIILLDRVSSVGFGPVVDLEERTIEPILWSLEPSANAKVQASGNVLNAIELYYALDEQGPWVVDVEGYGTRCGRVFRLPLVASNPQAAAPPIPLSIAHWAEVPNVPMGRKWIFPYLRARLLVPLVSGTVTLKFFFD